MEEVKELTVEKIGQDYIDEQIQRKEKLTYFLDGAGFNTVQFETNRESFKNDYRTKRLTKWVADLAGCKSTLEEEI